MPWSITATLTPLPSPASRPSPTKPARSASSRRFTAATSDRWDACRSSITRTHSPSSDGPRASRRAPAASALSRRAAARPRAATRGCAARSPRSCARLRSAARARRRRPRRRAPPRPTAHATRRRRGRVGGGQRCGLVQTRGNDTATREQVDRVEQVGWVELVDEWLEQPPNNLLNPSNLFNLFNPMIISSRCTRRSCPGPGYTGVPPR